MSAIYFLTLLAAAVILLAVMLEAIHGAFRRPPRAAQRRPALEPVPVVERRQNPLPFVGTDRRAPSHSMELALSLAEVRRGA